MHAPSCEVLTFSGLVSWVECSGAGYYAFRTSTLCNHLPLCGLVIPFYAWAFNRPLIAAVAPIRFGRGTRKSLQNLF
jgi:hypothetical protein